MIDDIKNPKSFSGYVIECHYFPTVDWFKLATKFSNCSIEQYERFQKMSYRNRCIISGSNGLINLTVPVISGREQKALIREVQIDYTQPWQQQHWRSVLSSYSRSPFFEFYADQVNSLLFKKHKFLFDLNLEIIEWLVKALRLSVKIDLTTSYVKEYEPGIVLDFRNKFLPRQRDKSQNWQPVYQQVFEDKFGFIQNLSIMDLLFCKGRL